MTESFKDYFSEQSDSYSKYRPLYPLELFRYLSEIVPDTGLAWDCAAGTGQASSGLAEFFDRVVATDASCRQIKNFAQVKGVHKYIASAENSGLNSGTVDLITVAQALHWLNYDLFNAEARRVLKDNGIIAIWSYNLLSISPDIDKVIEHLYWKILKEYWPPERKHIENSYSELPFPFEKIKSPAFCMSAEWSFEHLLGYLESWSAVRKYKNKNGSNPLEQISDVLAREWGDSDHSRRTDWPLTVYIGINKEFRSE